MPLSPRHLRQLAATIRRRVRADRADLVDFASGLIRVHSENPPGREYAKCARLIRGRLGELGLEVRTHDPSGEGPCVQATLGSEGRALYFSGHYDVVPAQDPSQFEPEVRRGSLFGRGSADMKGGLAAMAFAARALADSGFEPRGRLVCMAVPDEETSGPRGTAALAGAGLLEADALGMLTPEPTGGVVWNANRGVISARVTVRGRPAHVGLHFQGVNAFEGMLDVAGRFAAHEARVAERRTAHAIRPEAARRSILLLGGELSGGHNFNVVPDRVTFSLDRRFNPEEELEVEGAALHRVVDEARSEGIDCTMEVVQEGRSAATDPRSALGRALASEIRGVTGRSARFELCPGVLETRHYAALGVPALAWGPGLLSVSHGPSEHVSVERLVECAEVYARVALRLLG